MDAEQLERFLKKQHRRLTYPEVREVLSGYYFDHVTQASLAERYQVGQPAISALVRFSTKKARKAREELGIPVPVVEQPRAVA